MSRLLTPTTPALRFQKARAQRQQLAFFQYAEAFTLLLTALMPPRRGDEIAPVPSRPTAALVAVRVDETDFAGG